MYRCVRFARPTPCVTWKPKWCEAASTLGTPDQLDLLFIENVGNLVCPATYDLGEALRLVLSPSTEGEDKPLKYPTIFNTADIAVITKMDLAEAVDFDAAVPFKTSSRFALRCRCWKFCQNRVADG